MKKKLVIVMIIQIIIVGVLLSNNVYADPNSSKGFADYDDDMAQEESKRLEEQQKKEEEKRAGNTVSTNNYLSSLEVEGYTITPKFDKEITEYTLTEKLKTNEINIIAKAEDTNATIQGNGQTKIHEDENQLRVDVEAESGTVRTYFINIKKEEVKENEIAKNETNTQIEPTVKTQQNNNEKNQQDESKVLLIIIGIIIVIMVIVILIKMMSKKGKHA